MKNVVKKLIVLLSFVCVSHVSAMHHENGHQNGHDAKHPRQADQDFTLPGSTASPKVGHSVIDDKEFEKALTEACKQKGKGARVTELLTQAQQHESTKKRKSIQTVFLNHANSTAIIGLFLDHPYSRTLFSELYNIFIEKITKLTERSMTRTKTSASIKLLFQTFYDISDDRQKGILKQQLASLKAIIQTAASETVQQTLADLSDDQFIPVQPGTPDAKSAQPADVDLVIPAKVIKQWSKRLKKKDLPSLDSSSCAENCATCYGACECCWLWKSFAKLCCCC